MTRDIPDSIAIAPTGPIHGVIRPPGSKSITNRALVCAALAEGSSVLTGALNSEDTRVMIEGLRTLGIGVVCDEARTTIHVDGCGGDVPPGRADIFVANSGTTIRFLTALATLGKGTIHLDGIPRMRQRPIADLLDALAQLGATAHSAQDDGCPPVVVEANGLAGGVARIRGDISSQFLSGLLMAAPCAQGQVTVEVDGPLVSRPYVEMTLSVMKAFGVQVTCEDAQRFLIGAGEKYRGQRNYAIEPDSSAASYFWGAAAVTGGQVTVSGLTRAALQGDVAFCQCLAQMGCQVDYQNDGITVSGRAARGIKVDMNAISDCVQTLAAVALFAEGPTTITNVAHIRHKETDRIGDLATELRKLGARVEEEPAGLTIHPPPATARRRNHHLQRSPHGHEPGFGGTTSSGHHHPRSRLHGQNLPRLLRRSGDTHRMNPHDDWGDCMANTA